MPSTPGEPRQHHYVPSCWLAGFTETGTKDGRLFVTDFKRRKQWPATPDTAGSIRDFYRLEGEHSSDPIEAEKAFSKIEGDIAPILRAIDQEMRPPTRSELEPLLYFIGLQWARVPAFRPFTLDVIDKFSYEQIGRDLETPESWKLALERSGQSPDAPGADYETMKAFHKEKRYTVSAPTAWYVLRTFEAVKIILPELQKRNWMTLVSPSGSFIASDNPVFLDGPKGGVAGFGNAEFVAFPVSRHISLLGTLRPERQPHVNRNFIARCNMAMMLGSDSQVFSAIPDFCWQDENRKYQTDWQLFSKDKH